MGNAYGTIERTPIANGSISFAGEIAHYTSNELMKIAPREASPPPLALKQHLKGSLGGQSRIRGTEERGILATRLRTYPADPNTTFLLIHTS